MPKVPRASTVGRGANQFAAHGRMDLHVDGQINVMVATGPFNRELVLAGDAAQEAVDPAILSQSRWGSILVFQRSALSSPDALDEITQILRRRVARGIQPVAVALVLGKDVEGAMLMRPLYLKAYTDAGLQAQAFADLEQARQWVQACLDTPTGE